MESKYNNLLDLVDIYRTKYELLSSRDGDRFNVFSVLKNEREEVTLHSRFLSELLNPLGIHGRKDIFLEKFLETLSIKDFEISGVFVCREYKNIDIILKNRKKQAIIIENKIDAYDQELQISRYINTIRDEQYNDVWVVYLTIDGYEPSDYSLKNSDKNMLKENDRYIIASYKYHINRWLDLIIKESATAATLRETLIQYQQIVNKISGNTLSREYVMELKEILMSNRNYFASAVDIVSGLTEAKIELQWRYWSKLQAAIKDKGCPVDEMVSIDNVRSYYYSKRMNKDFGPETEIIKDIISVSIDAYLDLGIYSHLDKKKSSSKLNRYITDNLQNAIKKELEIENNKSNERWPWFVSVANGINFEEFNNQTIELIDDGRMNDFVDFVSDKYVKLVNFLILHKDDLKLHGS